MEQTQYAEITIRVEGTNILDEELADIVGRAMMDLPKPGSDTRITHVTAEKTCRTDHLT